MWTLFPPCRQPSLRHDWWLVNFTFKQMWKSCRRAWTIPFLKPADPISIQKLCVLMTRFPHHLTQQGDCQVMRHSHHPLLDKMSFHDELSLTRWLNLFIKGYPHHLDSTCWYAVNINDNQKCTRILPTLPSKFYYQNAFTVVCSFNTSTYISMLHLQKQILICWLITPNKNLMPYIHTDN